jgi:XTP/dITP diphosphohydrolase
MPLVVATTNAGKLREIEALLQGELVTLFRPFDLLGYTPEITEDGERFEDNAVLKATAIAKLTGRATLADDSGLEVDVLGGRPGVRSARFAGEGASDADNVAALRRALRELGVSASLARFRCAVALVNRHGDVLAVRHGTCEGRVIDEVRGSSGFGYDPMFVVTELGNRTLAELADGEKNAISHRGRALRAMLPDLHGLILAGTAE